MILRRIEGSRLSEVVPEWQGETVALIGGGPSLTEDQVSAVRDAKVRCIAVNDAYLRAPFADVIYAADSHWHLWQEQGVAKPEYTKQQVIDAWRDFKGQKCSISNSGANITDAAVHILRNRDDTHKGETLSLDPRSLVTGRNSAFQALNIATLAGAKKLILIGYDGQPGKNGKTHWHSGHILPTPEAAYELYVGAMKRAESALKAIGVRVINCSDYSAIGFEKMPVDLALAL